jgi:Flp pilus assembly protein TadB
MWNSSAAPLSSRVAVGSATSAFSRRFRSGHVIYDACSLGPLAEKVGVKNVEEFSKRFLPTLIIPALLASFNPLAALASLLVLLRLPHACLWYLAKERRKKIREELPLFVSSLKWMIGIYPIQKALCSMRLGETSELFKGFGERYSKGESFESALVSCAVFPELEELAKRLTVIYRTGSGVDLLDLYASRLSSENLSRVRHSAARMQIFAVAYTALIAVLPAMYSGMSLYSDAGNIMLLSFLAAASLVILWKVIE